MRVPLSYEEGRGGYQVIRVAYDFPADLRFPSGLSPFTRLINSPVNTYT